MITSKAFTIETRLNPRDNAEIIEYAKEYSVLYGKMIRFAWHRIKDGGYNCFHIILLIVDIIIFYSNRTI